MSPIIFDKEIHGHGLQEVRREDGSVELYSASFLNRQVYLRVPADHVWATMQLDIDPDPEIHGGCTFNGDFCPSKGAGGKHRSPGGRFVGWDFNKACNMQEAAEGRSFGEIFTSDNAEEIMEMAVVAIQVAIHCRDGLPDDE